MSDAWNDMKRAKEEEFFARMNREAMARLKAKEGSKPRLSPVTGEPMAQRNHHGIVIDIDTKTGYVGFDKGELQQVLQLAEQTADPVAWLKKFAGELAQA